MYGLAFPLIFPLALAGLINLYLTDKLLIIKWYRAPPNYD
jgi:hypothetical protein